MFKKLMTAAVVFAALPASVMAAPVALDGTLGAEWAGVAATHITYDALAPTSNFGSPTHASNNGAYDIYVRSDSSYLYAGLITTGAQTDASLTFANLYFALLYGSQISTIGFHVTSDNAFDTSNGALFNDTAANLIQSVLVTGGGNPTVLEVAIDLSVFRDNALGVTHFTGLPAGQTPIGVALFLSQSFGYSVVGDVTGQTALGVARVDVPEPGSLALVGLALVGGLVASRRRALRS